MPNIGPLELAIVLIIALIVFGPKRLPELGKSLGKGIREFKASVSGEDDDEEDTAPPPQIESPPAESSAAGAERKAADDPVAHDRG